MSAPVAYDYDTQRWVVGPEADVLLRAQAHQTLEVIDKPGYRKLMGYTDAQAAGIKAEVERFLARRT